MEYSLTMFYSAIRSEATKETYELSLNKFYNYHSLTSYDELVKLDPNKIQRIIEEFIH